VQAHRASGLQGEQRGDRLHRQLVLGAVGAAHGRAHHAHPLGRQAQHRGDHLPVALGVLATPPEHQTALAVGLDHATFGLEADVHLPRAFVLGLDHMRARCLGGGPRGLVAAAMLDLMQQVASFVHRHGLRRERGLGVIDHRQRFEREPDRGQRRLRDGRRVGRHRGNGVAHATHALGTQGGPIDVAQAKERRARDVGGGDDGAHARHGRGGAGVDGHQPRMRQGAAQDGRMELIGPQPVARIAGRAAQLRVGVGARAGAGEQRVVIEHLARAARGRIELSHAASPRGKDVR
jgi:hypothetical protein